MNTIQKKNTTNKDTWINRNWGVDNSAPGYPWKKMLPTKDFYVTSFGMVKELQSTNG